MSAARARLERLVPSILGLALIALQWSPMLGSYPKTPQWDGRFFFQQFDIAKLSLSRYGELALWNPFDCRGIAMWDHPESTVASPLLLLLTPLSTHATYYLWNIAHAVVGWFSMWLFSRRDLELTRPAAFIASAMWTVGAWHICQSAGSHETFITFFLAPLIFHTWRAAETSRRGAVATAFVIAWFVFQAGTYALPFTLVALGAETATRLRSLERLKRIVKASLLVGFLSALLTACRILPLADKMLRYARIAPPDTDALQLTTLARMFFFDARDPAGIAPPGQQYGMDEYVIYFGVFGVALALIGLACAWRAQRWTVVVAAVVIVLALGHFASWAPWTLLQRHVFPFTSMRVSARFILMLAFVMCMWLGLAIDHFPEWLAKNNPRRADMLRAFTFALGLFAVIDTLAVGRAILPNRFNDPPLRVAKESPRFYYGMLGSDEDDTDPDFINHPRQNHAAPYCRGFSFAFHQSAPIWTGDVKQARLGGPTYLSAEIGAVARTNNTFRFQVDAAERARIDLNSAYDEGWRSSVGTVVNEKDLLAVWVEPGKHDVELRYWPRLLTHGLVLSGIGLLLAIGLLLRPRLDLNGSRNDEEPRRPEEADPPVRVATE